MFQAQHQHQLRGYDLCWFSDVWATPFIPGVNIASISGSLYVIMKPLHLYLELMIVVIISTLPAAWSNLSNLVDLLFFIHVHFFISSGHQLWKTSCNGRCCLAFFIRMCPNYTDVIFTLLSSDYTVSLTTSRSGSYVHSHMPSLVLSLIQKRSRSRSYVNTRWKWTLTSLVNFDLKF